MSEAVASEAGMFDNPLYGLWTFPWWIALPAFAAGAFFARRLLTLMWLWLSAMHDAGASAPPAPEVTESRPGRLESFADAYPATAGAVMFLGLLAVIAVFVLVIMSDVPMLPL